MAHPFETLTPDLVLDAVESIGFLSDARGAAHRSRATLTSFIALGNCSAACTPWVPPARSNTAKPWV